MRKVTEQHGSQSFGKTAKSAFLSITHYKVSCNEKPQKCFSNNPISKINAVFQSD